MTEFIKGCYSSHEHDYVERPTDALQERIAELHINTRNIGYTGLRAAQVRSEINHISFELSERFRESKVQDIEEAWATHGVR